ncbi:MAG: hypothetical protein UIH27_11890 [Ruminococcus sp.]|nr:hypothetical protein [Ruminococcus sp.]
MPTIRMTLEEAINHCRDVASDESKCEECRENHVQLAMWLMELKIIRDIEPPENESALRKALIVLDRLNTTERVDIDREELIAAIKAVKPAARKQISLPLVTLKGRATDSSGNEIIVKQPCCPICGEAILSARQRRIKFCPSCGQAIDRTERRGDHAEGKTDQEL